MNTESNLYIYKYIDKHKALYNFVYHVVLNYDREINTNRTSFNIP